MKNGVNWPLFISYMVYIFMVRNLLDDLFMSSVDNVPRLQLRRPAYSITDIMISRLTSRRQNYHNSGGTMVPIYWSLHGCHVHGPPVIFLPLLLASDDYYFRLP